MVIGIWHCLRERWLPSAPSRFQLYGRWGEVVLRRRGYLQFLSRRPPHALRPDYADLWFLYRLVRKRQPRVVLEFGSGCSTVILGYALRDNGGGRLYSVECDPGWAQVTDASMPDDLRRIVDICSSPLEEVVMHGVPGYRHVEVPPVRPDLLYLDGPPLQPERQVAVDPLEFEDRFPPGFLMVIDGRQANVEFLARHLRRRYRVVSRPLFKNTVFELRG